MVLQSGSTHTWGGDVDDARVRDEFERMERHRELERAREVIVKYEEGFAEYRQRIEKLKYRIGRLDERLGD
jgi:ribosomal protein L15E